jgi:NAD(P)-dependent dehydrogenase (short-subunit alcohol dehydrogenase family)
MPAPPHDPLHGRVAVVTGAGRGLGRSHALLLASLGAAIVVNDPGVAGDGDGDRDSSPADAVVAEIRAAGGRAVANLESCASWPGAEGLVAQAVETFGSLDIVVNNAGILRDRMSFSMSEQDWDAVMDVNLKGHFAVSRFAAAHWRDRAKSGAQVYGRIVNTTSEAGLMGLTGQVNYVTAKAGVGALTMAMARELGKYGVTVNAIAPRARTRMTASATRRSSVASIAFDDRAPENVSPVVGWLAGPDAAHITGQIFHVYGSTVSVLGGWHVERTIDAGDRAWTIGELSEQARALFPEGASTLSASLGTVL